MELEERTLGHRPGPDWVKLKIEAIGICGSDIHAYQGSQPFQTYPRVLGHELAAVVAEPAEDLKEGQPVTVEPLLRCGRCYPCRQGRYNCCTELKVIGVHSDGGMCEFIWAPINLVYELPGSLPAHEAAMCEPLAIACQSVSRARITEDDDVLVIGAGPIGLFILQVARAAGARVFVSEVDPDRLKLARDLGADTTIDASREDPGERILELTGEAPKVVIEAVGSEMTIGQAIDVVSAAGRVVLVGLYGHKMAFEPLSLIRKELDVMGSRNSSGMFPKAIDLASNGDVDLGRMVTHRFPLEKAPEVFRKIDDGTIKPVKVVLEP